MKSSFFFTFVFCLLTCAYGQVHVTRFWHNHQPIYWPEWNSGVGQDNRVQYAHDSMRLKPTQNYGASWNHPHNDLEQIFGKNDRIAAYQGRPRDALSAIGQAGGFAQSYTGSLIDNIRNLSANGWNYGTGWNSGNTQARGWTTPSGSARMDMVGFSYHHSLTPLLPKAVLRKEIQIFKQAWWKAWGGNPNLSDHSKGFFPTEMAYSRDIIDVLVDEGYEWVIVASHHLSRTSPSYNDRVNPSNFQIKSSPPNRADQIGPLFPHASQWWFAEPNPGQAAWNVAPYAYQLHRVKYVDPATGEEKFMIAVPSDDVLSYQAGYSGAQIGIVDSEIAPHANVPNRPSLVMPATDGDNAWGGGYDSWMVSTPAFFGDAQSRGYTITTIQDFVNQFGAYATEAHIEEGAWIYPEMCYGSPYFLKWIEPPVRQSGSSTTYPNTIIDVENGWSLKFFAYAPKMAGANWVETAEQIWTDNGGTVEAWKIQAPYEWNGTWTGANSVELAWHIYLKGLDSGFQYYGGLGNDDEVKPGLAAWRAIETLATYMADNIAEDRTGPTVLKPQRFPYNPGGYTFGWFNSVPGGDTRYLKRMGSEFYVWSLVYDVSGVQSVDLMIRRDKDGVRSLANNHNETYAGGSDVEDWVRIPMTQRVLPNTRAELNALANHGQIDFVVTSPHIADQYFIKITDDVLPGFRDNLFDYYIEAVDTRGNITRTDIQHVYVKDYEGGGNGGDSIVTYTPDPPVRGAECTITYNSAGRNLAGAANVSIHLGVNNWSGGALGTFPMSGTQGGEWSYTFFVSNAYTQIDCVFTDGVGAWDNNSGQDWHKTTVAGNQPPTAFFTGAPRTGTAPLTVNFTDQSSGVVVGRHWDFGDGATASTATPQKTYDTAGSYTVMLIVSNQYGTSTNTQVNYVTVSAPGVPHAAFTGTPRTGPPGTTVQFTDQSTGTIDAWHWQFGDGETSTESSPSHQYTEVGTYTVRLIVAGPTGVSTNTKEAYITISTTSHEWFVDGTNIIADFAGAPRVLQDTPTGFGDAVTPGTGSELNALYITNTFTTLRVGITGNLETNGNCMMFFIDSIPATGINAFTDGMIFATPQLQHMAGVVFDEGFWPDFAIIVDLSDGGHNVRLEQLVGTIYDYALGTGVGDIYVSRTLVHDPTDIRYGFNNSNVGGVTETSVEYVGTVSTGWEIEIPLELLGVTPPVYGAEMKVQAIITSTMTPESRWISNQSLPGVGNDPHIQGPLPSASGDGGSSVAPVQGLNDGVVTYNPYPPVAGQECTITYNSAGRMLSGANPVYIHFGWNEWAGVVMPRPAMTGSAGGEWSYTFFVSSTWSSVECVFTDNADTWDNNSGNDWKTPVSGGSGGAVVTYNPYPPVAGQECTITYNSAGRNLSGANPVYIHLGWNDWAGVVMPRPAMTGSAGAEWSYTFFVSSTWSSVECVFTDNADTWDNNNGNDWKIPVSGGSGGDVVTYNPHPPVAGQNCTITYNSAGRNLSGTNPVYIHLGWNDWTSVVMPRPVMTGSTGGEWSYTFFVSNTWSSIECVFTDNADTWDNNSDQDWKIDVVPGSGGTAGNYAEVPGDQHFVYVYDAIPEPGIFVFVLVLFALKRGLCLSLQRE